MASLKEAAKARAAQQQSNPQQQPPVQMNHPTMDSAGASTRLPYNPPPPEKRFVFLKRFATVPGLRAKSAQAAAAQQR